MFLDFDLSFVRIGLGMSSGHWHSDGVGDGVDEGNRVDSTVWDSS